MSPDELTTRLIEWGVLNPGMDGAAAFADDEDENWGDRRRSPR
jgi:hypothetical protein